MGCLLVTPQSVNGGCSEGAQVAAELGGREGRMEVPVVVKHVELGADVGTARCHALERRTGHMMLKH